MNKVDIISNLTHDEFELTRPTGQFQYYSTADNPYTEYIVCGIEEDQTFVYIQTTARYANLVAIDYELAIFGFKTNADATAFLLQYS